MIQPRNVIIAFLIAIQSTAVLLSCATPPRSGSKEINPAETRLVFRDSALINIDELMIGYMISYMDSIWDSDTSKTKSALTDMAISGKSDKFLDSLENLTISAGEKYRNLYSYDSSSNRLDAKYDIIRTIEEEAYPKGTFYGAILSCFCKSENIFIQNIATTTRSDTLIVKKFMVGWSNNEGLFNGEIAVSFHRNWIDLGE